LSNACHQSVVRATQKSTLTNILFTHCVYYRIKKSDKAGCAQMKFGLVAEKKMPLLLMTKREAMKFG
jgi:hypothetical protein